MSGLTLPQATYDHMELPKLAVNGGSNLPTTAPTKIGDAHGRVRDYPRVIVEVDGACTVTVYVWSPLSGTWRLPSSDSSGYQKTFAAAGMDYFELPPGALFYLAVAAGSIKAWADANTARQGIYST